MIPTTPSGTRFFPIRSPFGLVFMPSTSPIGSSSAAISRKPSAISSIRCSVSASLSINDCFTPLSFAASISFAFSCKINFLSSTSSFATTRSPLFFAFVPSFAAPRDAFFASLPSICMYVSISVTPFIRMSLSVCF